MSLSLGVCTPGPAASVLFLFPGPLFAIAAPVPRSASLPELTLLLCVRLVVVLSPVPKGMGIHLSTPPQQWGTSLHPIFGKRGTPSIRQPCPQR